MANHSCCVVLGNFGTRPALSCLAFCVACYSDCEVRYWAVGGLVELLANAKCS